MSQHDALTEPVSLSLPFGPRSAGVARAELQTWLRAQGQPDEVVDDSRLVISELVGNAVRHARPLADGTVAVSWVPVDGTGLQVTVVDGGGETTPVVGSPAPDAPAGRGLSIVESLSQRWWWEASRSSSSVHALLRLA